jgi:hypothetical protein
MKSLRRVFLYCTMVSTSGMSACRDKLQSPANRESWGETWHHVYK